jgi:hypothetical protein
MKYSEVLNRYVNTGSQIPEEQYKQLSQSLQKSYMRMRGVVGYEDWEFIYLTDDERIKYIEKKGNKLNGFDEIYSLLESSKDKDLIITKIIKVKDSTTLRFFDMSVIKTHLGVVEVLLQYSNDKDLIATKIIEKMGYELNNGEIYNLLKYSVNKDDIAIKIINEKDDEIIFNEYKYLLEYSKDKELIKKLLLQNGVDYKEINYKITNYKIDTPLIPDNYQEMLNEIRRIKEIMR